MKNYTAFLFFIFDVYFEAELYTWPRVGSQSAPMINFTAKMSFFPCYLINAHHPNPHSAPPEHTN